MRGVPRLCFRASRGPGRGVRRSGCLRGRCRRRGGCSWTSWSRPRGPGPARLRHGGPTLESSRSERGPALGLMLVRARGSSGCHDTTRLAHAYWGRRSRLKGGGGGRGEWGPLPRARGAMGMGGVFLAAQGYAAPVCLVATELAEPRVSQLHHSARRPSPGPRTPPCPDPPHLPRANEAAARDAHLPRRFPPSAPQPRTLPLPPPTPTRRTPRTP